MSAWESELNRSGQHAVSLGNALQHRLTGRTAPFRAWRRPCGQVMQAQSRYPLAKEPGVRRVARSRDACISAQKQRIQRQMVTCKDGPRWCVF